MIDDKILESFKKKLGKEVEGLELFASLPDDETWKEEHSCVVMETKGNGRVWNINCTKNGNVKDYCEL